ncbi:MAG: hypothetical protein Kow00107_04010 [Planctomycetota bacterium]
MKKILTALLLPMFVCLTASVVIAEEEPVHKLVIECDGESNADVEANRVEFSDNVRLTWSDLSMTCGHLVVQFDADNRTPLSLEATGYPKNADERTTATARLDANWSGYSFRCRRLSVSFDAKTHFPREILAREDVWARLESANYVVHAGQVKGVVENWADKLKFELTGDASLPLVELGAKSFVATMEHGTVLLGGGKALLTAGGLKAYYDISPGETILPKELQKVSKGKLVVEARSADIRETSAVMQGADVSLGLLKLTAPTMKIELAEDGKSPKWIECLAGNDERPVLSHEGLHVAASALRAHFAKNALESFTAEGEAEITVLDSDDEPATAKCEKAVYTTGRVDLTAKEGGKVVIEYPAKGIRVVETRGTLTRGEAGRWNHSGFESTTEYIPKD